MLRRLSFSSRAKTRPALVKTLFAVQVADAWQIAGMI